MADRFLTHRVIPAEYLNEEIIVTFIHGLYDAPPQSFTGTLIYSGENTIRLRYFRRNHTTKRMRRYHLNIDAENITEWHPITNQPTLGI